MTDLFQALTQLAFREGPAVQATPLIHQVREQIQSEHGRAINYEVVLTGRNWDYLREIVAPRLAFFLRSKRLSIKNCKPVFLSIFLGETLYFVTVKNFYDWFRMAEGLPEDTFNTLVLHWEKSGQAVMGALPHGPKEKQ